MLIVFTGLAGLQQFYKCSKRYHYFVHLLSQVIQGCHQNKKKSGKLRLLAEQAGGRVNPSLNSEILKKIVKLSQYSSLGGGSQSKKYWLNFKKYFYPDSQLKHDIIQSPNHHFWPQITKFFGLNHHRHFSVCFNVSYPK